MNFAGNNIAISYAGSLSLGIRLYAIGLRLCITIRLLQAVVGDEISG
jgi:hypothetical protein